MNLVELADTKVRDFGEYVYAVFEDREITNVEMQRRSMRLARALRDLGVKRGDRVLVQMPNRPEVFESFDAIWRIGAAVVPVNHMIGADESSFIYQDCGGETLISSTDFLPRIEACRANAPALRNVILVGSSVPKGYHSYRQILDTSPEETGIADVQDEDMAAIIYTAGTT